MIIFFNRLCRYKLYLLRRILFIDIYIYIYIYIYISDAIEPYYQSIGIVSVRNSRVPVRVRVLLSEYRYSISSK